ncbi:MAG: multidrug effflux MFS transporter [Cellvibrionales bacterium]|nr:multidrug effflux MFS transporter [Cellvibrionales bacterium]
MQNRSLLILLASIIALGPLTIDLYLPAFPSMQVFFNANVSQVQLTLSSYLLGFAFFHLLCGPLSDSFGRKPVLLIGLGIYIVASIFCALANSIEQLILCRFIQGISACVAPILSRAIIRDRFDKAEATKALATVSSMMALAPVAAPTIGSLILEVATWQWTFYFLAICGGIIWLLVFFFIQESLKVAQPFTLKAISTNIITLIKDKQYMGSVLTGSFLYAPLFAFLSVAPFLMMNYYKIPTILFGAYFVFIVTGFISGNFTAIRISDRFHWQIVFKLGLSIALFASVLLFFLTHYWFHPLSLVIPMLLLGFTMGMISPISTSLALKNYSHIAATASALLGFIQMIVASIAGFLAGFFLNKHPEPLAIVVISVITISIILYLLLLSPSRSQELPAESK